MSTYLLRLSTFFLLSYWLPISLKMLILMPITKKARIPILAFYLKYFYHRIKVTDPDLRNRCCVFAQLASTSHTYTPIAAGEPFILPSHLP